MLHTTSSKTEQKAHQKPNTNPNRPNASLDQLQCSDDYSIVAGLAPNDHAREPCSVVKITSKIAQKTIYKHKNVLYTRGNISKESIMTQLELTQDELEELISAESHMYMDYDETRSNSYNEGIRNYNNTVDALINKMKIALQQAKEKDNELDY